MQLKFAQQVGRKIRAQRALERYDEFESAVRENDTLRERLQVLAFVRHCLQVGCRTALCFAQAANTPTAPPRPGEWVVSGIERRTQTPGHGGPTGKLRPPSRPALSRDARIAS